MIQIEDLFKSFNRGYLLGGMVKKLLLLIKNTILINTRF